jgi:hypothetical protein
MQAEAEVPALAKKITAKFSHYGTAENILSLKIIESGEPDKSKLKRPREQASVAWFTLANNADLPVAIFTYGWISNQQCRGLCDGAEISLVYDIELKSGEAAFNPIDVFSQAILLPKTTIYFSVTLKAFEASRAIYFGFTFQKDNPDNKDSFDNDYGAPQKLYHTKRIYRNRKNYFPATYSTKDGLDRRP